MPGLRKYLVTAALAVGLAFAGAVGAAGSAAAQTDAAGEPRSALAQEQKPAGALAWSCASWTHVLPPGIWGRSCRNSAPLEGAGEAFNGRNYTVRIRITVRTQTPWGELNLGSCDQWVAPGAYFPCSVYLSEAIKDFPVIAYFQQLEP